MSSDTKIIIFLVVVCWVALSTTWHWFRSRFLLKQWARANGFELVQMSIPWFKFNPFWASKRQEVYQIRVRDHRGRERSGWAKCGGFWLGFLVDKVEVEWDAANKTKLNKPTNAERQTIKVQVAKVVNFVCKWVVIGAVTVIFLFIYWWARWHH
jgi:hypothetical protein